MIPDNVVTFLQDTKSLPFRSMSFFNFLFEATIAGAILILVMLVFRKVFRKHVSSRLIYAAWILVALRLLLPVAFPNPLMDEFRPTHSYDVGARPVADQVRVRVQDSMFNLSDVIAPHPKEEASVFEQNLSAIMREIASYTSYGWLGKTYMLIYLIIAGGIGAFYALRHIHFLQKMKRNIVSDLEGHQLKIYRQLCHSLHVKEIPVYYVDPLSTPCLIGVFKPFIAMPLTLSQDAFGESLIHELMHYKRKDPWFSLLRCICLSLHWMNPLVWVGANMSKKDCEYAVDESITKQLSKQERMHYAKTLLATSAKNTCTYSGIITSCLSMTGKNLKQRVEAIVNYKPFQKIVAIVTAIPLVFLTVLAFSTAESTEQMTRLSGDTSIYQFEHADQIDITMPVIPLSFSPSQPTTATDAVEKGRDYLSILFPKEDFSLYQITARRDDTLHWNIGAFDPAHDNQYYLQLDEKGFISYVRDDTIDLSNVSARNNRNTILPDALEAQLMTYAKTIQPLIAPKDDWHALRIEDDYEHAYGRHLHCNIYNSVSDIPIAMLDFVIAPNPTLHSFDLATNHIPPHTSPQVQKKEQKDHTFSYTYDPSITMNMTYLGDTASDMIIPEHAHLTAQEAFDIAIRTMLERSGLTEEEIMAMPLSYGCKTTIHDERVMLNWRFDWQVVEEVFDENNRYAVHFSDKIDVPAEEIFFSGPGEGLG